MLVHIVPFTEIQEEIRRSCPEEYFTLIMRRFMMRIAEAVAKKAGAKALVTGESLGQVASQTMMALGVTEDVTTMPVLRPLIGMDKVEIIRIARDIGTFDTSILPYEDCCTVFTPRHPATRPDLEAVRTAEAALDVEGLVAKPWPGDLGPGQGHRRAQDLREAHTMAHTAELIAVGTELLLGNIANTNAQILSQSLSALGIDVHWHTVVGDNPQRLQEALDIARRRADILITTGGLGPTYDDLTKQTICTAFGKPLVLHPDILEDIRAFYESALHVPMPDNNTQQAQLPEGCTVFDNPVGTAPGCAFEADGVHVLMLPGPPHEMETMLHRWVEPYLRALSSEVIVSRDIMTFGMGESSVDALLHETMSHMENPTLATYAKPCEVRLRATAKAPTREAAEAMLDPVEAQVRAALGDVVYGVNVGGLPEVCLALLKERHLTFATAESCTGAGWRSGSPLCPGPLPCTGAAWSATGQR